MILGARSYIVTRSAPGSFSGGYYVPGAGSTWTIEASKQPLDARTLDLLPEGARTEARWSLLFDDGQELAAGDRVAIDGVPYLVMALSDWRDHEALPYRSAVLGEVTGV